MTVLVSPGTSSLHATVSFNTSQFSSVYTVSVNSTVYQESKNVSKVLCVCVCVFVCVCVRTCVCVCV